MGSDDFGIWGNYAIPEDRSDWNEKLRRFYCYWLKISPAARLPGRQHLDPLDIPDLMSRIWILDVEREPLRFRYRLAGTKEVETLGREVTGRWFDEVHPQFRADLQVRNRYAFMAIQGRPTYRKGTINFLHFKDHYYVENCMVPLARDGETVDMIMACSILYRQDGVEN
jgi:hypothetical protein